MPRQEKTVDVEVTYTVNAPPERVYDAWLDAILVRRWFGPGLGETQPVEVDARVGGKFRIVQIRDGQAVGHSGEYLVLERPDRLAFTWATDDDEGHDEVHVHIAPSEGGSSVRLVHTVDERWREFTHSIRHAWMAMLKEMDDCLRT